MISNPTIAFTQNRIQKGGRMQVMARMIYVLNQYGIIPDIITFKMRISKQEIEQHYGLKLEYNVKEIFTNPIVPFEWNILLFNFLSNKYTPKYDLIIDHNNSTFLTKTRTKRLTYMHFPRKVRNIIPEKNIHFPEGKKKSFLDFTSDPFYFARFFYLFNERFSKNETVLANSNFTKSKTTEYYDIIENQIDVLFPPVDIVLKKFSFSNSRSVVSLGRFAEDKRQLEQIKIAQALPDWEFHIIGFINNEAYYQKLTNYIQTHNIQNVFIHGNTAAFDRDNLLRDAIFFIHNVINEPFGITTVQAIASGCIPIVHNSGGQKEVVPFEELRFENTSEAIELFKSLDKKTTADLTEISEKLQLNIQQYSTSRFDEHFRSILKKLLPTLP